MKNLPLNSLFPDDDKDTKIYNSLKTLPHLYFSDKGIINIAKRFNVTPEHLKTLINKMKGGTGNGNQ